MLRLPSIANLFFEILTWLIVARVILSWIPHRPDKFPLRLLYEGTEPILAPFRKLMPKGGLPLDLSPILALLVLQVLRQAIIQMLYRL